jgi:AcrR family transcriptional regulator
VNSTGGRRSGDLAANPRQKTRAHLARLDEIKQAAAEQFYDNGYAATDVRSIADAVGLHVSTLYTYISGKEELLYFILKDGMVEISAALDEALSQTASPAESIRSAIQAHILHHATRQHLSWTGRIEIRSLTGDYRQEILTLRDAYQERWVRLIENGQRAGVIAPYDARLVVYGILGFGHSVAGWFLPEGRYPAEEIATMIADQLMSGLLVRD